MSKYKLVPIEPTREMWAAAGDAVVALNSQHHDAISEAVYKAMLTAAPVVEQAPVAWVSPNALNKLLPVKPSTKCPGAGCMDQGCPAHYATPDVAKLVEALEGLLAIVSESIGVSGYPLKSTIAKWDEFEEVAMAEEALAAYHQQGGDLCTTKD